MKIGICGKGRIGKQVADQCIDNGHQVENYRLNPELGLTNTDRAVQGDMDVLIICISPAKSQTKWDWSDILLGLKKQIEQQEVKIKQIILVSSTRVYEGIETGFVEANSDLVRASDKANSIQDAEQLLLLSHANVTILRCTGLIGIGYERYQEILATAHDRPRFAVNIKDVIKHIVAVVDNNQTRSSIYLMTDGKVHYKGQALSFGNDKSVLEQLALEYKLLVNSFCEVTQ